MTPTSAALAFGLIVYGVALTAAITSGRGLIERNDERSWNDLSVWNYLNAQVDAEGNQKITGVPSPTGLDLLEDGWLA